MKNVYFLMLLIIGSINAQNNCSPYYPATEGVTMVMHHFNQKNKLSTKTEYQVGAVNSSGSTTEITMLMNVTDGKKNKIITNTEFTITCDGGTTYLDPESIISPKLFDQYKEMEYSIDGDNISLPNSLEAGQELPNGKITMSVDAGVMSIDMTVLLENRKVETKERITTPAGFFDCYLITYTNTTNMSLGMRQTLFVKQWVAKGIGLVQQETRKPNGKLIGKTVLAILR